MEDTVAHPAYVQFRRNKQTIRSDLLFPLPTRAMPGAAF